MFGTRTLERRALTLAAAALALGASLAAPRVLLAEETWCDERCTSKYGYVHYHWYSDGEVAIHEYQGCSGNIFYVKCYYG